MAKRPMLPGSEAPTDFPQVEPSGATEMFPTTNIRWVISETAKLTERVDTLRETVDKVSAAIEKASERQSREMREAFDRHATDMRERIETAVLPLVEIKADLKDAKGELKEIDKKVAFVRGAMWAIGAFSVIATLILGALFTALARKWIG